MATFVVLPARSISAEPFESSPAVISDSIVLSFKDKSDVALSSGSHTKEARITIDWTSVTDAQSYSLYTWSDTRAPSVRLLDTTQISLTAEATNHVANSTTSALPRDGNYFFAVKALDKSGAEIAVSETATLTLDTIQPRLSVINPKFNQEIIGNSLIVNGTVSDVNLDYYYFILRNSAGEVVLTSSHIAESVVNGVIANLDINTFLSGSYDIAFIARDKAGNQTAVTNVDETASFIVLRKGDNNSLSNPPRPQELAPSDMVPVASSLTKTAKITPEFKLVTAPEVLGATNSADSPLASMSQNISAQPDATIIAVAKNPTKNSDSRLYLALIPMILAVVLLNNKGRQTVSNNFPND